VPVHCDSKVDKFDKRLRLVLEQIGKGDESVTREGVSEARAEARPVCSVHTCHIVIVHRSYRERSSVMVMAHTSVMLVMAHHAENSLPRCPRMPSLDMCA